MSKISLLLFIRMESLKRAKKSLSFESFMELRMPTLVNCHMQSSLMIHLENADLIFYVAHSGHGLNFDFKKIMNELKMSEAEFQKGINKNPYQMLGIISCFSSTDHFNEYFNYRDDSNTSDLIIMDTEGYPYLSPISFVRYLDDLISKEAKASSLGAYLRKYSDRESLSIHRE
jgi:hypothetical protein